ncbi:transglycosylase SLT domain-containing protein [Malaciobacter mytili]|uniref:transglycosylase SLT domain-containing protein n=1 Tax=Malaciobacter mytili TaxID=603050 RepID=UPI003A89FEFA
MIQKHLVFILLVGLLLSQSLSAVSFNSKYDAQIQKSVKLYWADFEEWKYWKAQLYQESRLKSDAVSPVGAMGLAQFMPRTWKQISKELDYPVYSNAFIPSYAIYAGAYYMRKLRNGWSWNRPVIEKNKLAQASYNAGMGSILKAQKKCGNAKLWDDIKPCLKEVTGHHCKETITYVERIKRWYGLLQ